MGQGLAGCGGYEPRERTLSEAKLAQAVSLMMRDQGELRLSVRPGGAGAAAEGPGAQGDQFGEQGLQNASGVNSGARREDSGALEPPEALDVPPRPIKREQVVQPEREPGPSPPLLQDSSVQTDAPSPRLSAETFPSIVARVGAPPPVPPLPLDTLNSLDTTDAPETSRKLSVEPPDSSRPPVLQPNRASVEQLVVQESPHSVHPRLRSEISENDRFFTRTLSSAAQLVPVDDALNTSGVTAQTTRCSLQRIIGEPEQPGPPDSPSESLPSVSGSVFDIFEDDQLLYSSCGLAVRRSRNAVPDAPLFSRAIIVPPARLRGRPDAMAHQSHQF